MATTHPQHIILISLTVVVKLRFLEKTYGGVWEWLADAASELQINWFDNNRRNFVATAHREGI